MNYILATLFLLISLAVVARGNVDKKFDPCLLLTNNEIQSVQGHAPAQKVSSEQPAATFRFTQCYFRTPEFSSSVSLAVGMPLETDNKRSGPRQYWQQQFHSKKKEVPGRKKKEPPKRINGLGDEAFWVGDQVTGALYALKGDLFVRVSVGGPGDQAAKIKRARALATHALKRLR